MSRAEMILFLLAPLGDEATDERVQSGTRNRVRIILRFLARILPLWVLTVSKMFSVLLLVHAEPHRPTSRHERPAPG